MSIFIRVEGNIKVKQGIYTEKFVGPRKKTDTWDEGQIQT